MKRIAMAIAVFLWLASASNASAYPYFQLSSDTNTCNQCHYAPAGGGMLTGWGRMEAADTISRGGDGALLHGAFEPPSWLDLGGDLRLAALFNETGASEGAETALFPMQADLSVRIGSKVWSVMASAGLKSAARHFDAQANSERKEASLSSYAISREHYVQWRPETSGPYARAGRFYAPFGLRLPDHTSAVRRTTGFNLLEETYGVSGGFVKPRWELHVTAHISDPVRWAPRDEVGATAMYERRASAAAYGVSARATFADADQRFIAGAFGKYWSEATSLLWMAEVDTTLQRFADVSGADRYQLAAYAGPVWIPTQGLYVAAAYELFDEDLLRRDVERHAAMASLSFFPRAHWEVMLMTRATLVGTDDHALTALGQLHYYP